MSSGLGWILVGDGVGRGGVAAGDVRGPEVCVD